MSANIRAEKNKYILLKSYKKKAEVTVLTGVVFHISLQQMMSGSLVCLMSGGSSVCLIQT